MATLLLCLDRLAVQPPSQQPTLQASVTSGRAIHAKPSIWTSAITRLLIMVLWLGFFSAAQATHFRYGSLTWKPTTGRTIQFKLSLSYRRSFYTENHSFTPNVGTVSPTYVPVNFNFGDGVTTTRAASWTVTSVNATADYFFAEAVFTHTYTSSVTSFTAGHYDGERLSSPLVNNHDQVYGITTVVNVGTGSSSPVSSLVPIVNLAAGLSNATFLVPASDPNGNPLTFSLATPNDLRLSSGTFTQPTGLSITSSGQVTFNTTGKTVGQYYNAVVKISDGSSFIVVDFLIQLVANTGTAPVFVYGGVTPANGSTIQGIVGIPVSFTVRANDTDVGSTVTLNASGLPVGSSFPPVSGTNTASSVFSYTPTVAGNSVITFSAIDNIGKQTLTSVTLQICSPINPSVIASNMGTLTCSNPLLMLTANGGGGSYYVFLGPNLNQTSTANTAAITQAGTYTVTVSGGNSCPTSVTTTVVSNTVTPQNVTLSSNGTITCAQTSVVLSAGSSTTGLTYAFSGVGITAQSSNTATVNQPGTYTVVLTGTNGCKASATTSVTSDTALPSISITPTAVTICAGQSTPLTASGGASYVWSTTDITSSISVTAAGPYSVTATGTNGCINTATANVTVVTLPVATFMGLPASACVNASPLSLSPTTAGGSFAGPGVSGNTFNPASAGVGGPYTITYTVTNQTCSNISSQTITVQQAPQAPTLVTAAGQPYPAGVSSLTISQNVGDVILTVSSCAGGTLSWSGGSATALALSTVTTGIYTYSATCSLSGCTSPVASFSLTVVPTTLLVLHRDQDYGNTQNNIIKPFLELANAGNNAIPYGEVTVRYWFTSEGNAPPINLAVYYAQLGTVNMQYMGLSQPRQGALGYVEYSFPGGGNLAAGGNSGPIENGIQKTDGSNFNEADDYSYQANYADYVSNAHITAYRNGVIFWGQEPTVVDSQTAVQVYSAAKDEPTASQIQTRVELRNTGNVALPVANFKLRYYFTSDNGQLANVYVDYASIGASNVQAQVVRLSSPVNGADSYAELSFPGSTMQLNALSSLGYIDFRVVRSDYGLFDQTNDYSYAPSYGNVGLNTHVTAYLNNSLVFGSAPSGAARIITREPVSALSVRVLGNPVIDSQAQVEIRGVEGHAVNLRLVDLQGRSVHEQRIESAGETEQVSLPLGQSRGTVLLKVSTASQQQSLKLMRP